MIQRLVDNLVEYRLDFEIEPRLSKMSGCCFEQLTCLLESDMGYSTVTLSLELGRE